MTMEEKLELLLELLMLADLSKETTLEETSDKWTLARQRIRMCWILWRAAVEMCAPAACT